MRKITILIFMTTWSFYSWAQVTIQSSDMPNVNDTIRVSNSIGGNIAIPSGGMGINWNYSTLNPISQNVVEFLSPTSLNYIGLNNNVISSYAVYNWLPDSIPGMSNVPIERYDFFKENSSELKQVGQGLNIFNVPLPVFYTQTDRIYKFPLAYPNQDSTDATFTATIPGLFYWNQKIHRANNAMGYGFLTTPFGTFNTVLVKSEITTQDSIYIDTLGAGLQVPARKTIEYKWLKTGGKIPMLQINTAMVNGNETVTQAIYPDSAHHAVVGIDNLTLQKEEVKIYPNPSQGKIMVYTKEPIQLIHIFDAQGRLMEVSKQEIINTNQYEISENWGKGIYFMLIKTAKGNYIEKLIID